MLLDTPQVTETDVVAPVSGVAPDAASARRPLLTPARLGLAGLAVAMTVLVATTLDRRLSTDVFWQLAAGQWMLAHHRVMGLDPFSYTESHRHWVADEWGSEVIFASLYKLVGSAAYNLIAIITGSLSLLALMGYLKALGVKGGRLAGILIVFAFGIAPYVTQDRGLSFSLIWLPLELLILTKARSNPRWLCWLPPLCLLWVNTHGSILLGIAVIGVEWAWSVAPASLVARVGGLGRSVHSRAIFLAGVAGTLAACISPYGPKLLVYDLGVSTNNQISQYIVEWLSPDFHSVGMLLSFLVPLLVFIVAVWRRRVMVLECTLTAAFFVAALHSTRIAIYLFVAVAGLAATLPIRRTWAPGRVMAGLVTVMIVLIGLPAVPAGSVTTDTPVAAFNFLEGHPGRIFTQYTWGDYSIARHRATFVDGRTDLFTGRVLSEFLSVTNMTTNPEPVFDHYDVSYVVWAPSTALSEYLSESRQWVVVDRTAQADIFARRSIWPN
jgi:hypothetical protein